MENKKNDNLTPEQKEKKEIELENKILSILLPSFGGVSFILGLTGFILAITENVGVAIFLLIIALIGAGCIAYGVLLLLKKFRNRFRKEEVVPSEEPDRNR